MAEPNDKKRAALGPCRCGHSAMAHLEHNADLFGFAPCQPKSKKGFCACKGYEEAPPPNPCPLGNARHSRAKADCLCIPGQLENPAWG